MSAPVICFGQQPCGFFPKRFLVAKIKTAQRLQREIGGRIVFFYHDSDHDHRETRTLLRHRKTDEVAQLNFAVENKIQRKHSPAYLKTIAPTWQEKTAAQLTNYIDAPLRERFNKATGTNVADFCLALYHQMGLLEGIEIARSSDPSFRRIACEVAQYFVDLPYSGQTVRARRSEAGFQLHEGGDAFVSLPLIAFTKEQVNPARDSRLIWMQSVIRCTHYIAGNGEQMYLKKEEAPEIQFRVRDAIERSDEAYVDYP